MSNFKEIVEKKIVPFMGKISANKVIQALTAGMMATMPLSLGTSIVAIVANFPVTAWTNWLAEMGISQHTAAVIGGTTEVLGLFLAFIIAYTYSKLKGSDPLTAGVLSLGTFIILMPQKYTLADGKVISVLQKTYLGSSGIFVAMICGILIAAVYNYLDKKGFGLKLPDSVPEMVSKSLSPTFIAMIIFIFVLLVRIGFGNTSYGNIFDFINSTIAKPIMLFGTSPVSLIAIYALVNLLWCFGIHPSSLTSVLTPVFMTAITTNIADFQAAKTLTYLTFMIVYFFVMLGGTGSTLGLAIDMTFFSKSKRYKSLGKLSVIPNIFNINEPLIFGTPIIFNPIFMLPMTLAPILLGSMAMVFVKFGIYNAYNPTIKMPWTMPAPIVHLFHTGVMAALCACGAIVVSALLYYPFFKIADRKALKEEQEAEKVTA